MDDVARAEEDVEARVERLLAGLSLEDRVALMAGADSWTTRAIPPAGVPAIKVTDGPNGARGGGALVGGLKAACFPAGIALAATWNPGLVEQVGRALAEEAHSKGARVLLAPTVNLHRSPLNGRNFECYSEDPYLSARVACACITGVQAGGVAATVKHFVGNESEFQRTTISSEIDERTLRELYLVPFEAAVTEAGVWAIMAAYNRLNGTLASEHAWLLQDILRREWGFDGVAMSDWFATRSTVAATNAGLDLEMPGPTRWRGERLLEAIHTGAVDPSSVEASARRILRLIARVGALDQTPSIPTEQAIDRPAHRALIRQAGAEAMVLLKNDGLLPLDAARLTRIAVIGPNAATAQIMGGGSAQLSPHYRVSPLEGIAARVGDRVRVDSAIGCTNDRLLPVLRGSVDVAYFNSADLSGDVVFREQRTDAELMWLQHVAPGVETASFSARATAEYVAAASGAHAFGLVSAGLSRLYVNDRLLVDNWAAWQPGDTYFGDGSREMVGQLTLEAQQTYRIRVEYATSGSAHLGVRAVRVGVARPVGDEALEHAVQLAAESDVAIVCVGLNGDWDTEGRDRPHLRLVGRQDELIARVAAVNPRTLVALQTGGPVAMPWLDQVSAVLEAWYPGQECGNALADVVFGDVDAAGRLPETFPVRLEDTPAFVNYPGENGRVRYGERMFVGYRYYDARQMQPLFPFGHGLSYTTFAYANLRLSSAAIQPGEQVRVTVEVTNTGGRPGHDVLQVYVAQAEPRLQRPPKELKAFAKVWLDPGETRALSAQLDMRALAYFDDARAAWVADAGRFEVLVGRSAQDIRLRASVTLAAEWLQPVGGAAEAAPSR